MTTLSSIVTATSTTAAIDLCAADAATQIAPVWGGI